MAILRVKAPDGTLGNLDEAGNFTPDPPEHRTSFDPAQDIEPVTLQPDTSAAGQVAKVSSAIGQSAPAITTAYLNNVPFGLGPKLAGTAARLAGAPFSQQEFGAAADQLNAEHPTAATIGKAGALATEMVAGQGAGELLGTGIRALGTKLPGLASKLATFAVAHPILTEAAETGAGGAAYGAAGNAGEAASHGQDVGDAAITGAEAGGAGGVVLGAVAGKLGKLFREAPQNYQDEFARDFIGTSVKKDKKAFSSILNKEAETNVDPEAAAKYLQSPDLRPIRDALIDKDYGTAIEKTKAVNAPLLAERIADYKTIDGPTGGIEVGKPFQELKDALFSAENSGHKDPIAASALKGEIQRFKTTYSSAPSNAVKDILGRTAQMHGEDTALGHAFQAAADAIPEGTRATRATIYDATKAAPAEVRDFVDKKITGGAKTGILSWDPSAKIPTLEYRDAVSTAQKNAVTAMGTLNATENAARKAAVKIPLNKALEAHLDEAAAKGPEIQKAVDATRARDVKLSLLATVKDGIKRAQTEVQGERYKVPLHERIGKSAGTHAILGSSYGLYSASHHISDGEYSKLPGDAAEALIGGVALPAAFRGGAKAAGAVADAFRGSVTNGAAFAKLRDAALKGNPRAVQLLKKIANNAVARGSAAAGTVTAGTLGDN